MKKRLFAFFLAIVMFLGAMPTQAIATMLDEASPNVIESCATEGCTLGKDHTGYCSNAPTYCQETSCKLYYKEVHSECIFCETEGCSQAKEKHDLCLISSNLDPADPTEPCTTEGCTLGKDHAGYCSNAPAYCENAVCLLHYVEQHEVCEYCATENCTRKGEVHTECLVPTYCENETCLLQKTAEHENCEFCVTDGCELKNEIHTECKVPDEDNSVTETTESTDPTQFIKFGLSKAVANDPASIAEDPDKPTNLNNQQVYVAVYTGTNFPGEPAWYSEAGYRFYNSSFNQGSPYSNVAANVLNPEILNHLVQGPTTDKGVKVWGYYNAAGTKSMIIDSNLLSEENENKIIRNIKGRSVNVNDYKIIWYVIKYQTDTDWHIDGLVVLVDKYNVNYYGNGNTSGGAPNGVTGLKTGDKHTVSGNSGKLERRVGSYAYTFTGWNTKEDGTGTHYDPSDVITITDHDISLYAQWTPPSIGVTVSKRWEDNNDAMGHRPNAVTIKLLANGVDTGKSVTLPQNNSWTYTFTDLAALDNNRNLINYSAQEVLTSNLYTASYSGDYTNTLYITNRLNPDMPQISDQLGKVFVTGNKNWLDRNNAANSRPNSITVNLYANGTKVDSQTVTGPDWGWAFDISNGFVINGQKVNPSQATLTVAEEPVAGYQLGNVVNPQVIFNAPSVSGGWKPTNPCNSLSWFSTESSWSVVAAKTTGNGPVVIWTPRALAQYERDLIMESLQSSVNGLKENYQFYSGQGTGGYGIQVTSEELKFSDTSDWSKFYVGTFNVGSLHSQTSSITNIRQEPVPVTKIWNDTNNQDGKRPASVTVHLLDSTGEHVFAQPAVLNAQNNWSYEWNVPLYDANGNALTYSVYEEAVEDYTSHISGDAISGFTVINTHTPATVKINATKAWNDDNDRDGVRPAAVLLQLYADNQAFGDPVTVDDSNSWTYHWSDLQKHHPKVSDADTTAPIVYTVKEVGYLKGDGTQMTAEEVAALNYSSSTSTTASGNDADLNLVTITNSRTTAKTSVDVTKVWEDAQNQDGLRPTAITVTLYEGGVATNKTLVLNEANNWAGTFADLHKYAGGKEIIYSVKETAVEHYTSQFSGSVADGFIITNTHTPIKTQVTVTKQWQDEQNQDGIRPASITVALFKDGADTGKTIILTAGNSWTGTFTDLDLKSAGKEIEYTVREIKADDTNITYDTTNEQFIIPASAGHPTGYIGVVAGSAANGFTITNTHTPDEKKLNVTKIWNDGNNQDGKRPYAIEVSLFVNGQRDVNVAPVVLLSDGNGQGAFAGTFPIYHGGTMVNYSVQETGYYVDKTAYDAGQKTAGVPSGYGDSYSYNRDTMTNTYATVTNSYTPQLRNLTVEKNWNDADNQDGLRPGFITVKLQQTTDALNATQVNWVDTGKTATLNPANEWQYTFVGLPEYQAGKDLRYRVVEDQVEGYEAPQAVISTDLTHITLTNTHNPAKTFVKVVKSWNDGDNQDGKRPTTITVELYANGDAVKVNNQPVTATLNEGNNWTHTFTNLDLKYAGKEIVYSVKELEITDYTTTYSSAKATENAVSGTVLTVTNTHIPETITVPVVKEWDDQNNNDGKRPTEITVTLQKKVGTDVNWTNVNNGVKTITAADLWTGIYENLPVYEGGKPVSYQIVETAIPFYNLDTNGDPQEVTAPLENNQFKLINTHTPMTVTVVATKVWDDSNNQDGIRPDAITLHLLQSGKHMEELHPGEGYKITLNPDYTGTWPPQKWTGLPMYADGQLLRYGVTEEAVPGYETAYNYVRSQDNTTLTATITNSYTPKVRNVIVEKLWDDAYNQDGLRPDSIRVKLYHKIGNNWEEVKDANNNPLVLDVQASNGWVGSFTNLPVNYNGAAIVYNVEEIGHTIDGQYTAGTLADYTVNYAVDQITGNLEVKNVRTPYKASLTVTKDDWTTETTMDGWKDENNQDGIRPDSVTISLYKNNSFFEYKGTGANPDGTVTLNAANNWSFTFENLDIHYGIAQNVLYRVVETEVPGYTAEYSHSTVTLEQNETKIIGIVNTHAPEKTQVSVTKVWKDENDQDGIRPDRITVALCANGTQVASADLSVSNNWQYTFADLNKKQSGTDITYTVKEILAEGNTITENSDGTFTFTPNRTDGLSMFSGYTGTVSGDAENGFVITNVHKLDQVEIWAKKVWADANNQDGKRPDKVRITLYANGHATEYTVELTGNETTADGAQLAMLPRFHNGQRVNYSIVETHYQEKTGEWKEGVIPGYSRTYHYDNNIGSAKRTATVINSYTPDSFNLQVEKAWEDNDNQDGIRPESVTIKLQKTTVLDNPQESDWVDVLNQNALVLSRANEWQGSFMNLPKNEAGQKLKYRLVEELNNTAYTVSYSGYNLYDYDNRQAVVTNTHIPYKGKLIVIKDDLSTAGTPDGWKDNDNQDGKRPTSVTVTLYANGSPVLGADKQPVTRTLNAANGWTEEFTDLDIHYGAGRNVLYSVVEQSVAGYTASYSQENVQLSQDQTNPVKIGIVNTHTPETITATVVKNWVDQNNNDGKRPATITVTLQKKVGDGDWSNVPNGNKTISATGLWTDKYENLPAYENGQKISYRIVEDAIDYYNLDKDGKPQSVIAELSGTQFRITNTHEAMKVTVEATKYWDDAENADNSRPTSITLHLLKSGHHMDELDPGKGYKVTLSPTDGKWPTQTWENLPMYEDGQLIRYTVTEEKVDGYNTEYSFARSEGDTKIIATITNSRAQDKRNVTVEKLWDDTYNQDGLRPDSIRVQLYHQTEENSSVAAVAGKTLDISSSNGWVGTFTDLPVNKAGFRIVYSVQEIGYTKNGVYTQGLVYGDNSVTYTTDKKTGDLEVRNHHAVYTGNLQVRKASWVDANNQDGLRTSSVTVKLFANNVDTGKTVVLNDSNNWTATFENVPIHYGIAQKVIYSVREVTPAGYTATYSQETVTLEKGKTASIDITNTHIPEKTQVSVAKVWQDGNDQDGLRPDKLTVTLFANGAAKETIDLTAANGWKHTFTNLDKKQNGDAIVYTVEETQADGRNIRKNSNGTFTIEAPQDGSVKWLSGYEGVITGTAATGFTITNTHTPDVMEIFVKKNWNDSNNNDGARAAEVEITLFRNGEPTTHKVTLTGAPGEQKSLGTFPRFHNGQRISYSVEETQHLMPNASEWKPGAPKGYTATYSYNSTNQASPVATVTNTKAIETFNLQVEKTWNDQDNQDGIRPQSVTVALWGRLVDNNGNVVYDWADTGKRQTMSEANLWTASFVGLSRYQAGIQIQYKVEEEPVAGYTASGKAYWEMNQNDPDYVPDMYHLTNTHVPVVANLKVTKTWDDANDQDGIRPDSVTFQLYRNGVPQSDKVVTVSKNSDGTWPTYTFEDLPVYFHGTPASYSVVETPAEGYTAGYRLNPEEAPASLVDVNLMKDTTTAVEIVNSHTPAKTQVSVAKAWNDQQNQDGIRPASVTVGLYVGDDPVMIDGKAYTLTLDATNNWSAVFTNVDAKSGGQDIPYTVKEVAYQQTGTSAVADIAVVNGKFVIPSPDLNNWSTGYEGVVEGNVADGYTITNTHVPEVVTVTARKFWDDDGNRDGHRWEKDSEGNGRTVRVHLLANDTHTGEHKVLTEALTDENGYQTLTWENLPKYSGGHKIAYTVFEEVEDLIIRANTKATEIAKAADRYYATYVHDPEDPYSIHVTNTYVPETISLSVMKVWNDDNNRDGIRPHDVIMTLHKVVAKDAQGNITQSVPAEDVIHLKLSPEGNWHGTWQGLPKYEDGGKLIEYTVVESAVAGYNKATNGQPDVKFDEKIGLFTVTNTYEPAVTKVEIEKIWEDENDNDGIRPAGIVVQLYANALAVEGATAVLDATTDWKHVFGENDGLKLFVKQNIQGISGEIRYEVAEIGYVDADGNQILDSSRPVAGYTPSYQIDGYKVTITNTHALEKTEVNVTKVWDDDDDNDGKRPESVKVTLLRDGAEYDEVMLSQENGWKHTWSDLGAYLAGEAVVYTVVEEEVEGYESVITGSAADGFIITNTHEPEIWETDITKVWKDNNSSKRPRSVTVQLYKDGAAYGDSFKITKADGWKYPVELPMYEDGKKLEWTVKEIVVPTDYNVSYDQQTLTITNKIKPNKNNPITGDFSSIGMWAGMMGTSGAGAAMLLLLGKKKKPGKFER